MKSAWFKIIESPTAVHFWYSSVLLSSIFLIACNQDSSQSTPSKPNTEMAALLKLHHSNIDPLKVDYHLNTQRAEAIKNNFKNARNEIEKFTLEAQYAYELFLGGKTEEAIISLETLRSQFEDMNMPPAQTYNLRQLLGLAYFRLGEQQNCIKNTSPNSCIIPIRDDGIYNVRNASETAISIFSQMLLERPDDPETKWLLNIAYMTLGEYPDQVPEAWLIEPESFEKDSTIEAFENLKLQSGLGQRGLAGGVCLEDFNNDGLLDIFTSSWGIDDQLKYFINDGKGSFTDASSQTGLEGITGGLNMIHADYNNDGYPDILILRGAWYGSEGTIPNSLLKNNGDGSFTDVTKESGLLSFYPTQTACWADFNNDGWIDLFIGNETTQGAVFPCELYLNNEGHFTNVIAGSGLENIRGLIKGVCAGDIDNDGLADIYISMVGSPNSLFKNMSNAQSPSEIKFKDVTKASSVTDPIASFPCWMWDYNHDGWNDIFVAPFNNMQYRAAEALSDYFSGENPESCHIIIYQNLGNGGFQKLTADEISEEPVFAMGGNYGDVDNNGYLDFYLGTGTPNYSALVPNKLFINNSAKGFTDASYSSRLSHVQKGHAIAIGDIDNDGDQDIFHVIGGAFEGDVYTDALFLNSLQPNDNFLTIILEGKQANRSAIGARITVDGKDKNGKTVKFYHTVSTGGSFGSSSLRQEIGLGPIVSDISIEITWPDSSLSKTTYTGIQKGSHIKIIQGEENHQLLELKKIPLSQKSSS